MQQQQSYFVSGKYETIVPEETPTLCLRGDTDYCNADYDNMIYAANEQRSPSCYTDVFTTPGGNDQNCYAYYNESGQPMVHHEHVVSTAYYAPETPRSIRRSYSNHSRGGSVTGGGYATDMVDGYYEGQRVVPHPGQRVVQQQQLGSAFTAEQYQQNAASSRQETSKTTTTKTTTEGGGGSGVQAITSVDQSKGLGAGQQTVTTNRVLNNTPEVVNLNLLKDLPAKFEKIRSELYQKKELYVDPDFPANNRSITGGVRSPKHGNIVWLRPHEIAGFTRNKPRFTVDGYDVSDLNQGELGNCYLICAFSSLTTHNFQKEHLISKVIPPGQNFNPAWYAGMFCFRFFGLGEWVDVIIDDRLPTVNGKLIFLRSMAINEFWSCLLEKAYANYEGLSGGLIREAMEDVSGGLSEYFDIKNISEIQQPTTQKLTKMLKATFIRKSLIGAGIEVKPESEISRSTFTGQILANGLVGGHAFTVTDVHEMRLKNPRPGTSKVIELLRIRNPWGNAVEWKGRFSDNDALEWEAIVDEDRKKFNVNLPDGEFWMDVSDFRANFDMLDICHMPPPLNHCWKVDRFFGEWQLNESAGGPPTLPGPRSNPNYWTNPQFEINIDDISKSNDIGMVVGLKQTDVANRQLFGNRYKALGFFIYRVGKDTPLPLSKEYLMFNNSTYHIDSFLRGREVVQRFDKVPFGRYVIIPCTYETGCISRFYLRVFYQSRMEMESEDCDSVKNTHFEIITPDTETNGTGGKGGAIKGGGGGAINGGGGDGGYISGDTNQQNDDDRGSMGCCGGSSRHRQQESSSYRWKLGLGTVNKRPPGVGATSGEELDAFELAAKMNNSLRVKNLGEDLKITSEISKKLILLYAIDGSFVVYTGQLDFIVNRVIHWLDAFNNIDGSRGDGVLNSVQLKQALQKLGIVVPDGGIRSLVFRYGNQEHGVTRTEFVSMMASLVRIRNQFIVQKFGKTAKFTESETAHCLQC